MHQVGSVRPENLFDFFLGRIIRLNHNISRQGQGLLDSIKFKPANPAIAGTPNTGLLFAQSIIFWIMG